MAGVVVIFPVLRRPHRVFPLLESLAKSVPPGESYRPLFVCTRGDDDEIGKVLESGADHLIVDERARGDYAWKVNEAYRLTAEPFLFLGADDLFFHWGWLGKALDRMADPSVGVVGTNDLGNARVMRGEHSTHSLVRRSYCDEFGTIDERRKVLHEGYPHEYVDDEFIGTAKHRGAYAHAGDSLVEHLHPNWGKGETDALYEQQHPRMRLGRKVYWRRNHLWAT